MPQGRSGRGNRSGGGTKPEQLVLAQRLLNQRICRGVEERNLFTSETVAGVLQIQ